MMSPPRPGARTGSPDGTRRKNENQVPEILIRVSRTRS